MKVYSQLEKAQLENLASAPANAPLGYVYFDTAADQMKVKTAAGFSTVVSKGLPPAGSIVAYIPGFFNDGSNNGHVPSITNSIAAVNAEVNGDGWYVCDGSELNLPGSRFFDGSSRFLPNLTNSRFLMGSNASGVPGGQNSVTLVTANLPGHTHTIDHDHGTHTHTIDHNHGSVTTGVHSHGVYRDNGSSSPGNAFKWTSGTNSGTQNSSTAVGVSVDLPNFTGSSGSSPSINLPAGTQSGSTGSATAYENRPLYLSVFYIQRAI